MNGQVLFGSQGNMIERFRPKQSNPNALGLLLGTHIENKQIADGENIRTRAELFGKDKALIRSRRVGQRENGHRRTLARFPVLSRSQEACEFSSRCAAFHRFGKARPHVHILFRQQIHVLVERMRRQPFAQPVLLNVNVPDRPFDEIRGFRVTRLGKRHKAEPVVKGVSPRGETVYWVGAAGSAQDAGDGTDFHAVENGFVSITPLQIDLTHNRQIGAVTEWLAT